MELTTHIPGPGVRDAEGEFRGWWDRCIPDHCLMPQGELADKQRA